MASISQSTFMSSNTESRSTLNLPPSPFYSPSAEKLTSVPWYQSPIASLRQTTPTQDTLGSIIPSRIQKNIARKPVKFLSHKDLKAAVALGSIASFLICNSTRANYESCNERLVNKTVDSIGQLNFEFCRQYEATEQLRKLVDQTNAQANKIINNSGKSDQLLLENFQKQATETEKEIDNNFQLTTKVIKKIRKTKRRLAKIIEKAHNNQNLVLEIVEGDRQIAKQLIRISSEETVDGSDVNTIPELKDYLPTFTKEIENDIEAAHELNAQAQAAKEYASSKLKIIKKYRHQNKTFKENIIQVKEDIKEKRKQVDSKQAQPFREQPEASKKLSCWKKSCLYMLMKTIYRVVAKVFCTIFKF